MLKNIIIGRTVLSLSLCFSGWCPASQMSLADSPESVVDEIGMSSLLIETSESDLALLPTSPIEASKVKPTEPETTAHISNFGIPIASHKLSDLRGGFDVVKNDMQLSGVVTNNSAVDVMTGSNTIASGSFANSSGFPMVVQNSGSNVLIQNATIINLQYQ